MTRTRRYRTLRHLRVSKHVDIISPHQRQQGQRNESKTYNAQLAQCALLLTRLARWSRPLLSQAWCALALLRLEHGPITMKRTVYTVQCAMGNGTVTSFTRYAWNAARRSIVETLRATGQAWEKIDSNYEKVGSSHVHGSEVWQNKSGEKVRFVINKS